MEGRNGILFSLQEEFKNSNTKASDPDEDFHKGKSRKESKASVLTENLRTDAFSLFDWYEIKHFVWAEKWIGSGFLPVFNAKAEVADMKHPYAKQNNSSCGNSMHHDKSNAH